MGKTESLDFVGARSARLQFAVFAFEDVPVGATVTHAAYPLYEGRLGFEEVERMVAVSWNRHDGKQDEQGGMEMTGASWIWSARHMGYAQVHSGRSTYEYF
jgi:hypothetical protein